MFIEENWLGGIVESLALDSHRGNKQDWHPPGPYQKWARNDAAEFVLPLGLGANSVANVCAPAKPAPFPHHHMH